MKKFYTVLALCCVCCTQPKDELERFTVDVLESLQNHDLEKFTLNSVDSHFISDQMNDVYHDHVESYVSDMYLEVQDDVHNLKVDLKDFDLFEVRQPYKKEMYNGLQRVKFYAVIKNKEGRYLKLKFKDCLKTETGFLLVDEIEISENL